MSHSIMNVLRLAVVGAALLFGAEAFAQTVSGQVVDTAGQPVIGATVIVDGTQNGVSTDLDGRFTLRAAAGTPVTVSILGYRDVKTVLAPGMVITVEEEAKQEEEEKPAHRPFGWIRRK